MESSIYTFKKGTVSENSGKGPKYFANICEKHSIPFTNVSEYHDDGDYPDRCAVKGCRNIAAYHYDFNETSQPLPSNVGDLLYNTPIKLRGYTSTQTAASVLVGKHAGVILVRLRPDITKAQHAQLSKTFSDMAKKMESKWGKVINKAARETWGRDFNVLDYRISGIGSDEFSEKYKKELRTLAQGSSKAERIALAHEQASKSRKIV